MHLITEINLKKKRITHQLSLNKRFNISKSIFEFRMDVIIIKNHFMFFDV